MELKALISPLWKWKWIIITAGILAGVVSFLVSTQQPPQYLSRTTLLLGQSINNPNPNTSQFYLEQQLATIYADMATREPVRKNAMEALGLTWLPSYNARAIPDTQLIEISVTDTDPFRAQAVAAELANQLINRAPTSVSQDEQNRQSFIDEQLTTLQNDISQTKDEIETKKLELGNLNSASQISSTEQEIRALENKLSTLQDTYASLLSSSSKGALNTLSVIEPAEIPARPIGPNNLVTSFLAMVVGFFLAAAGIYVFEWLDQTLHNAEEANRILNVPLLGEIPRMAKEDNAMSFVNDQPFSPITDAFRSLRNNLEFLDLGTNVKTILVTSPGVSEGKTTIAINLALSLSKTNKRVILMDADFYQSRIQEKFAFDKRGGLGDILESQNPSISDHFVSLFNGQLYLLPSGKRPNNPSELLSSPAAENILSTLKKASDIIIIDGPPFITSDAFVLASKADGVLVVVSPGRSRRDVLRKAKEQMNFAKARVLGYVLNGSTKRMAYYNYYQQPEKSKKGKSKFKSDAIQKQSSKFLLTKSEKESTISK